MNKADVYCGDVLRASGRIELLQYHATVVTVSLHGLDPPTKQTMSSSLTETLVSSFQLRCFQEIHADMQGKST